MYINSHTRTHTHTHTYTHTHRYEPLLRLNPEAYVSALEAKGEELTLQGADCGCVIFSCKRRRDRALYVNVSA